MTLDFTTLYIIILLNSLSFAVVWAVIALAYRSIIAARYWFWALATTCVGGPMLLVGNDHAMLGHAGLAMVSGSFTMMWQGLRVFNGQKPLLVVVAVGMASTFFALTTFGISQEAINLIAAIGQIAPVALVISALMSMQQRHIGAFVAALAATIIVMGQSAEAGSNLLRLTGHLSSEGYYRVAAWFLVCAVIGGSVWNLGFLLMVEDRLRYKFQALTTHDDLTNLLNRRGLRERITFCEESVRRNQGAAVLMMIDLDKFKAVNDHFGHAAGDAALVSIASITKRMLRDDDVLARVGGDEFCVLLPHTDLDTASALATRLTAAIAVDPFVWKGQQIKLSASIGLTEWTPRSNFSLADSISLADDALFETKRGGRNGHSVFDNKLTMAR